MTTLNTMIQTTFAPCGNPFRRVIRAGSPVVAQIETKVFNKHTLAHFYRKQARKVYAKEAAEHFGVSEPHVYRTSAILAREGCVIRIKKKYSSALCGSWRYIYEFKKLPVDRDRVVDTVYDYLRAYPGITSAEVRDGTGIGNNAPEILLRMYRMGRVTRVPDLQPYRYFIA